DFAGPKRVDSGERNRMLKLMVSSLSESSPRDGLEGWGTPEVGSNLIVKPSGVGSWFIHLYLRLLSGLITTFKPFDDLGSFDRGGRALSSAIASGRRARAPWRPEACSNCDAREPAR